MGDDIPNANTLAPSPPITGPLSESYRSLREKMSAFSWKPEEPREPSTHSTLVLAEGLCSGQVCIIGFSSGACIDCPGKSRKLVEETPEDETNARKEPRTRPFPGRSVYHFFRRTKWLSHFLVNLRRQHQYNKKTNMPCLRCLSFVILMENCPPVCKPESNPAGCPPAAAKYTQGCSNEPCVME